MLLPNAITTDLLILSLLGACVGYALTFAIPRRGAAVQWFANEQFQWGVVWLFGLILFVGLLAHLIFPNGVSMDSEAGFHAVAFQWLASGTFYHPIESDQRIALLYGPLAYLPYALAFKVFGGSQLVAKLVGVVFFVGALACLHSLFDRCKSPLTKPLLLTAGLVLVLPFGSFAYYPKAEPLLLFLVSLPVALTSPLLTICVGALAAGLSFWIKATAPIYFLPLLAFYAMRSPHPGRHISLALTAGLFGLALPAIWLDEAKAYFDWLAIASNHPLVFGNLTLNVRFVAVPIAFSAILWRQAALVGKEPEAVLGWALLLAAAACVLFGSKLGAGAYHLLPLIPAFLVWIRAVADRPLALAQGAWQALAAGALGFACLVWGGFAVLYIQDGLHRSVVASELIDEIGGAARRYQCTPAERLARNVASSQPCASVAMGYGQHKHRDSNQILDLMDRGGVAMFTDIALWDTVGAGLPFPEQLTARIARCDVRAWLVPAGDTPFATESLYDKRVQILPPQVQTVFQERYRLAKRGPHFDAWECK